MLKDMLTKAKECNDKIKPIVEKRLTILEAQLLKRASTMERSLAKNYDAVFPYTAEGEIFFHYSFNDLWKYKLVKYDPRSGNHEIIELKNSMLDCKICQIDRDIFKFKF